MNQPDNDQVKDQPTAPRELRVGFRVGERLGAPSVEEAPDSTPKSALLPTQEA